MAQSPPTGRKTALDGWHRAHGARMCPVAGWEVPFEYSGMADEHVAVRTRAGVFDMSHLGQVEVAGRDALDTLQQACCSDVGQLEVGQVGSSALTTPAGTFLDSVLVYRLAGSHFLLVTSAANTEKDAAWIAGYAKPGGDVAVLNTSTRYALIAVQGPVARELLEPLTRGDLSALASGCFDHGEVAGVRATIARTGRTGEDGYEVLVPPQQALKAWNAVLAAGAGLGAIPAGLGAYDTLRLEAGWPEHGREIDESTTVLEAGLETIVAWDKGDFSGRAALAEQRAHGIPRRLIGFEMVDRVAPERGSILLRGDEAIGTVTSGADAPSLEKAIAMGYVRIELSRAGSEFEVDVRGARVRARVVPLPFYKRRKG